MPSLSDTLDSLSSRTSELAYLTTLNSKPAGKFTQAYLNLPSSSSSSSSTSAHYHRGGGRGNVLELIRDSNESEKRLFKFIGESTEGGAGGSGGNKRVEKRENVLVTPLKEMRSGREHKRDEVEVVLRTALRLVDDYRPMPRARAHIANLLDSHHSSQERLVELERLIEEASKPLPTPSTSKLPTPPQPSTSISTSTPDKPKLTPEEAIKAEEASLRALEASLIPLRKSLQVQQSTISDSPPPPSTRQLPSSPPISASANTMQTPAKTPQTFRYGEPIPAQTPAREMPHVTNSLVVNGMTPRRVDRFSPLKLITPTQTLGSSGLKESQGEGEGGGRRSIFGRPSVIGKNRVGSETTSLGASTSGTSGPFTTPYNKMILEEQREEPIPALGSQAGEQDLEAREQEDETIRIPRAVSPPTLAPPVETPTKPTERPSQEDVEVEATPQASSVGGNHDNGGVDVDDEGVKAGIAKVWSTLGDMMRQGVRDGESVDENVQSSVQHLLHLSNSSLPSPPSPSSSSISSLSAPPSTVKPITSETILFAHLFLAILRSPDGVDMNDLKDHLTSIAKARNFDSASSNSTKIIYAAVGKRVVRIDRKGGMVKVKFAD